MTSAGDATVFIIDGDDGECASIQGLLKSAGLRSEACARREEFLHHPRSEGPSCLVLDVRLPGVSGLDFQHQLTEAGVPVRRRGPSILGRSPRNQNRVVAPVGARNQPCGELPWEC